MPSIAIDFHKSVIMTNTVVINNDVDKHQNQLSQKDYHLAPLVPFIYPLARLGLLALLEGGSRGTKVYILGGVWLFK